MADGEIRLALPIHLNTTFRAKGEGTARVGKPDETRHIWLASPGAGYLAAKLIMRAPTIDEARDIWSAFYSTEPRTDTHVAGWAFSHRLEEAGYGHEVYDLAYDLAKNDADMTMVDDEMQEEIRKWARRDAS